MTKFTIQAYGEGRKFGQKETPEEIECVKNGSACMLTNKAYEDLCETAFIDDLWNDSDLSDTTMNIFSRFINVRSFISLGAHNAF